jgi:hypothetical protein
MDVHLKTDHLIHMESKPKRVADCHCGCNDIQLRVNEANETAIAETSKTINYTAYCNLQLSATCVQKLIFYWK